MKLNFNKYNGLIPAVIQDNKSNKVLMLGFMDEDAYEKTQKDGKVTFFSRSKNRLWTKGETSGNFLLVKEILSDCDDDTLLIKVEPTGPVCHKGSDTCFNEENKAGLEFIHYLEGIIRDRKENPSEESYTSRLFGKGLNKIAQKLGEEAVELLIEAKDNDEELFKNEAADLLFHYLILLAEKGYKMDEIIDVLMGRHKN